jgi:hypothetical protein
MSGTEAAWLPWAGAALGGLGGYLGGSRPEQAEISGYGHKYPSLHPEALFQGATGDLGRLGALYAQRAQMPVSMPSSYVQPLPMFKGGVVDAFGLGMDPAFPRPELQTRGGVNFGSRDALPFQQGGGSDVGSEVARGGREVYGSSTQPASPFPTFGGAHSELGDMQKALAMLRPSGAGFQFTGARGVVDSGGDAGDDGVDYTLYGTPPPGAVPDPNNPDPYQLSVTDSSGQLVPIDPSTGEDMGRPFPGGEYAPIPGMSDPDNPGSSFMPDQTGFMRGVTRRGRHVSPPRLDPLTGQPLQSPPGIPSRQKLGTTLPTR